MRFLVDMPLPPALARRPESKGHHAVHASSPSLNRTSDAEILERAAEHNRTVITADLDYPRLLVLSAAAGPSLILFRGGDWREADVIARMDEILRDSANDEVAESILVVERNRLRRRRLPWDRSGRAAASRPWPIAPPALPNRRLDRK